MGLLVTVIIVVTLVAAGSFVAYQAGARMKERYSEDRNNPGYRDAARVERERNVTVSQLIKDMPRAVKFVIAGALVVSVVLVLVSDQGVRQDFTTWYNTPSERPARMAAEQQPALTPVVPDSQSGIIYKVVPNGHRGMLMRNDGRLYGVVLDPGSHFAPLTELRVIDCRDTAVTDQISAMTSDGVAVIVELVMYHVRLDCTNSGVVRQLSGTALPVYGPQQLYQQHVRSQFAPSVRSLVSISTVQLLHYADSTDRLTTLFDASLAQSLQAEGATVGISSGISFHFPERGL